VAYIVLHGELVTYIPPPDAATSTANIAFLSYPYSTTSTSDASDQYPSQDTTTGSTADETASQDVTRAIRQAGADPNVKAIVLEIDSWGGVPVAGEEVEATLKEVEKPTVALIRSQGESAAYAAATGADTIFAADVSDVGDIGVTESYVDNSKQDIANGLTFNQLSVGKYKDMFNPDTPLTPAERAVAMHGLQVDYQIFVQTVAKNRHMSIEKATSLANGAAVQGEEALQDGLIDKIGNVDDVRAYLTGVIKQNAVICGIDM
jgi:protease-4